MSIRQRRPSTNIRAAKIRPRNHTQLKQQNLLLQTRFTTFALLQRNNIFNNGETQKQKMEGLG